MIRNSRIGANISILDGVIYVYVISFPQQEHIFHMFLIFRSPKRYSNSDVIYVCIILCLTVLRLVFHLDYV